MIRRKVAALVPFALSFILAQAAQAIQADPRGGSPQDAAIEEIRKAYAQKHDEDVIVLADRALHDITMRGDVDQRAGEIHFWRGASLRRLGRDKEALVALEESKARGFNTPELHLELALVRRSQGDTVTAERDFQEAERILPSDLEKQERLIDRWNREGKEEPRFKLTLSPQAGYDSNIVGLDPNTPLIQGNTRFDSAYYGAYLDTRLFLVRNSHQTLELDYQNLAREYPSSTRLSFDDNVASLLGRQPLSELADLEVRASIEDAFMKDDGNFRVMKTLGTGLILYPTHDLQLHLFGDWSKGTYFDPTPDPQDRDGDIYRIGLEAAIDLGRNWTMGPYVTLNKYNALGSDYVSRGWDVGVVVRPEEVLGLKISATVDVSEQDYTNLNSVSGFTVKRRDRPVQITLAVVFKALERSIGYAPAISVTYVYHESNISVFQYHRWDPQVELGMNVLSF